MLTFLNTPHSARSTLKPGKPFPTLDRDTLAVVTEAIPLQGSGQVEFRGSWWTAISASTSTIPVGAIVQVVYPLSLPLQVKPVCR